MSASSYFQFPKLNPSSINKFFFGEHPKISSPGASAAGDSTKTTTTTDGMDPAAASSSTRVNPKVSEIVTTQPDNKAEIAPAGGSFFKIMFFKGLKLANQLGALFSGAAPSKQTVKDKFVAANKSIVNAYQYAVTYIGYYMHKLFSSDFNAEQIGSKKASSIQANDKNPQSEKSPGATSA